MKQYFLAVIELVYCAIRTTKLSYNGTLIMRFSEGDVCYVIEFTKSRFKLRVWYRRRFVCAGYGQIMEFYGHFSDYWENIDASVVPKVSIRIIKNYFQTIERKWCNENILRRMEKICRNMD